MNIILRHGFMVIVLAVFTSAIEIKTGDFGHYGDKELRTGGYGSNFRLVEPITNPFKNGGNMRFSEAVPVRSGVNALHEEPVPASFQNRQDYGGFVLPSVLLEEGSNIAPSDKEEAYLNTLLSLEPTARVPHTVAGRQASLSVGVRNALFDSSEFGETTSAESGIMEFTGPCSNGYTPFRKVSETETVDNCWSECEKSVGCTQVHFRSSSGECYLSRGISGVTASNDVNTEDDSVCRSLTAAGVAALRAQEYSAGAGINPFLVESFVTSVNRFSIASLPSFTILPNNAVKIAYSSENSSSNNPKTALSSSLAECQSFCLQQGEGCVYGLWTDQDTASTCTLASQLLLVDETCPNGFECKVVCGEQDCVLFESFFGDLVEVGGNTVNTTLLATNTTIPPATTSPSCEKKCGYMDMRTENACVSDCLAKALIDCQTSVGGSIGEMLVAFTYGGFEDQLCGVVAGSVGSTTNSHTGQIAKYFASASRTVPSAMPSPMGSLLQGKPFGDSSLLGSLRQLLLTNKGFVRPQFTTYFGACSVFHEGLLLGSGVGVSKFSANSLDECWNLCASFAPDECTQVQFNLGSKECVLGDAISTGDDTSSSAGVSGNNVNPSIMCRSLNYMPTTSSNGLPGMLFVDSVGAPGVQQPGYWFSNAAEPQLVDSLEQCQALCKQADAGSSDAVCRYGGYVDCGTFHASVCGTAAGGAHVDCQLCDRNPGGGVCRIPRVVDPSAGFSSGSSNSTTNSVGTTCLGGQCRWFEKSAPGFALEIKTPSNENVSYLPTSSSGLICGGANEGLPLSRVDAATDRCYFAVESLWHCEQSCVVLNEKSATGLLSCLGGLYEDNVQGEKRCYLAQYRQSVGAPCSADSSGCGWFEVDGLGHTATLEDTGMDLAAQARASIVMPFDFGIGKCAHFKSFGIAITKAVADIGASNMMTSCSQACMFFPQCVAFQVDGSKTGSTNGTDCNLVAGAGTDCSLVTCQLSSAITPVAAAVSNSSICWSKTAPGTVDSGPELVDMDGIDPGLPGFITTNARVRKFEWADVSNKNNLALTTSLEDCQSLCRTTEGCSEGTWQSCMAVQQYCNAANPTAETNATCAACSAVHVSDVRPSVAFPPNFGVCKVSSKIASMHTHGCDPEPCYSFHAANENYYLLALNKSPFLLSSGSVDSTKISYNGELGAFVKAFSLDECESHCSADPNCKYGHFAPMSSGAGSCFLTSTEVRAQNGDYMQLKNPVDCNSRCVVFYKLPTSYPGATGGSSDLLSVM